MAQKDDTDTAVREQVQDLYERFPYPPPDQDIGAYVRGAMVNLESPKFNFHLYWPYREPTEDLDILVAGCGTSQAATLAAGLPQARIVATDISSTSLQSTANHLKSMGRENVRLEKLPIEEIAALGLDFDLIISTGVLHHLADPEAGLKALAGVLRAEGSMFLMLYGKHGRTGVYMLQEMFRRLGITPSTVTRKDLKNVRELVQALPPAHPFSGGGYVDHLSDEGLVDLLLHVQDRAYSLPDIYDFLDQAELKMQRLMSRALYDPKFSPLGAPAFSKFLDKTDTPTRLAAGELLRGSISRHSFVACHQARAETTYEVDCRPANWDRLIPVPNRSVVPEMPTPARPSVRLTNPMLNDNSLFVDVDLDLEPFLKSLDGRRTVREMLAAAAIPGPVKKTEARVRKLLDRMGELEQLGFRVRP